MYIPEFWCGVATAILVEFALLTVMAIIETLKGGEDNETAEKTD